MNSILSCIIRKWRDSDVEIRSGVSREKIHSFQQRFSVVLPAYVRDYFLAVDGIGDDMDENMNRFWPLAEVKPVQDELSDAGNGSSYPDRFAYPDCFVFADHCIWCWAYAVRLTTDPKQPAPVFRVTASDVAGEQMTSSFEEFMSNYAQDSSKIL